jgi:ABC-type phosphate/phosphonate transport system substrate-binding protein
VKNISFKTGIISFLITSLFMLAEAASFSDVAYGARALSKSFYYFNPDSSQSNLARLKQEMEHFLKSNDLHLSFQPFAKYHDFHRELANNIPEFVFLPEWYFRKNKKNSGLKPLLQPVRNGQTTYRKILLTSKDSPLTLQKLHNKTLAMTTMGRDGAELLETLIFNKYKIQSGSLNIIATPKDSDALFALAVRQVDAALVAENNLQKIGTINPRILQIVRSLAESQPIPLPILCAGNEDVPQEHITKLKKIFLEAQHSDDSANLMEMLQIDAWHTYPN